MQAAPLAAPVMETPRMARDSTGNMIPRIVELTWSYPEPSTLKYVKGYTIYMKKDPQDTNSWQKAATITNPGATSRQIANLETDTTYYFQMTAYGDDIEASMSERVSIHTPLAVSGETYTNSLGMTFRLLPAVFNRRHGCSRTTTCGIGSLSLRSAFKRPAASARRIPVSDTKATSQRRSSSSLRHSLCRVRMTSSGSGSRSSTPALRS